MNRYLCLILASAVLIATGGLVLDRLCAEPSGSRASAEALVRCGAFSGGGEAAVAEACVDEDGEDLLRHEQVSLRDLDPVLPGLAERSTGSAGRSPRALYRPPRVIR